VLVYFVPFFIALIVAYALTPSVKKLAIKVGAVDRPNARKVHTHIIPRLGGLAIYIGFLAGVLYSMPMNHEMLGLLLGCTAIVCVGIWDDICNIPAKVKLVGQILSAAIPVAFGIQIEWLTNPFGNLIILPEVVAIPLTIFWIIGFTNTVNLIDGLDGCRRVLYCVHFDVPHGCQHESVPAGHDYHFHGGGCPGVFAV